MGGIAAEVRLWPHFAAISTHSPVWLALRPGPESGPGPVSPARFGRNLRLIRWGNTMFDFQELFQWDRFIGPVSTEIERERTHSARQVQGRRL